MTTPEIKELLCKEFPTARPGFVDVLILALAIHAEKNNDYTGNADNKFDLGLKAKFFDINRKFSRLYYMLWEERKPMVGEQVDETTLDLGVYAFLLCEELRKK